MDSFRDKLAQKFGTQDVIRVNSEAEAKELETARATIKEYENILSEVRRLSLKCVETNEMTNQLVQAGIERFEAGGFISATDGTPAKAEEIDAIKAAVSEGNESLQTILKEQEEFIHKENVRVYRNVQASIVDELKLQTEAIATQNSDLKKKIKKINSVAITSLVFNIISMLAFIGAAVYVLLTVEF